MLLLRFRGNLGRSWMTTVPATLFRLCLLATLLNHHEVDNRHFLLSLPRLTVASASPSLFSSNVVMLTPQNWKSFVLDSPHAVFVSICRSGCGYCQRLQPEWEQLAGAVQGLITIAYWDTEQGGQRPRLLGEIQGTPTIRLFKPKKKQRNPQSNAEKIVIDYRHGERTAKDMKTFLENEMPNYSERITFGQKDLDKALQKAKKYGLPVALLFSSKAKTSPVIKFLSTHFRRRLLLVEIPPTTNNQPLMTQYGIENKDALPALLILSWESNDVVRKFEGDKFTRRKLQDFLSQHALSEPVYQAKEQAKQETTAKQEDPIRSEF